MWDTQEVCDDGNWKQVTRAWPSPSWALGLEITSCDLLAQFADVNSLDRRAYDYIWEIILRMQIYTKSTLGIKMRGEHWLISFTSLFVIHLTDYNETLTNVCKFFSHWNYMNIWYNKTLLAWYFKKLNPGSLTGEVQIGLQLPFLIDFGEVEGEPYTYLEGNVLCRTKEKRFLQIHVSPRF